MQSAEQYRPFFWCLALLAVSSAAARDNDAYRPPRLDDGHPDLQGYWDHTDSTPVERPRGFKTLVISPAEAAQIQALDFARAEDRNIPAEPTEYFNARRMQPIRGELRSSIIVDPEDGTIPGTPLFQAWQAKVRFNVLHALDGPEQRPTSERCLGNPASQPPHLYNPGTNLHQIMQNRGTVIFVSEVMHDARVIRMNAKHGPAAVTSWLGDAIGWWEGDTLVVETKYFTAADTGRLTRDVAFLVSPQTTVTERFTLASHDELNYVFTVEDPTYYTRPWKGETHLMRTTDRILEYACHEANYSLRYILQGGRAQDDIDTMRIER